MIIDRAEDYLKDTHLHKLLEQSKEVGNLGAQEEMELVWLAQMGDQNALDRLVISNLRFCYKKAKIMLVDGVELDDLFREAVNGLIVAIMKHEYGPPHNAKLLSYATWWIWSKTGIHNDDHSRTIKISRAAGRASRMWTKMLGGADHPTTEDLAERAGVEHWLAREAVNLGSGQDSLNEPLHGPLESSHDRTLEDVLPSYDSDRVGHDSEQWWLAVMMDELLTERQQKIIRQYYFEGLTLEVIGRGVGIGRERVRQDKDKALAKLKRAINKHDRAAGLTKSDRLGMIPMGV